MHTEDILPKLHEADSRWKEYGRSEKPITDKGLARLLKGFRIKPGLVTIGGTEKRGYRVADFDDAFNRYCPSSGCDFCGEGERADDPLLTVYDGDAKAQLHRSCWPSMGRGSRAIMTPSTATAQREGILCVGTSDP